MEKSIFEAKSSSSQPKEQTRSLQWALLGEDLVILATEFMFRSIFWDYFIKIPIIMEKEGVN